MEQSGLELRAAVETVLICDLECAKITCEQLLEGYFIKSNPDPLKLEYSYHKYATMASIIYDYILSAQAKLDEATENTQNKQTKQTLNVINEKAVEVPA